MLTVVKFLFLVLRLWNCIRVLEIPGAAIFRVEVFTLKGSLIHIC